MEFSVSATSRGHAQPAPSSQARSLCKTAISPCGRYGWPDYRAQRMSYLSVTICLQAVRIQQSAMKHRATGEEESMQAIESDDVFALDVRVVTDAMVSQGL